MTDGRENYANFWLRFASGLVDLSLLVIFIVTVTWLGLALSGPVPGDSAALHQGVIDLWTGTLAAAVVLAVVVALMLCWCFAFASPGQLLMGCQVTRSGSRRPLSLPVAVWRGCLLLGLGGPLGIPLLSVFFDRRRQGLHDWLSGSVVRLEDESQIGVEEWTNKIA